jgi:DNA-binding MarR family transcriptional regulator
MASFRDDKGDRDFAMGNCDALADARLTEKLRQALTPVLPYGPSLIPMDILITVSVHHETGNALTMKQLLAVLPYSVTGIRYNLAQLIADGWITKARRGGDRRLVFLIPSDRVREAFAEVRARIE